MELSVRVRGSTEEVDLKDKIYSGIGQQWGLQTFLSSGRLSFEACVSSPRRWKNEEGMAGGGGQASLTIPPASLMRQTVKMDWMEGCKEPVMDWAVSTNLCRFRQSRVAMSRYPYHASHHRTSRAHLYKVKVTL